MEEEHEMSSLQGRRSKSLMNISCCFIGNSRFDAAFAPSPSSPVIPNKSPSSTRSYKNLFFGSSRTHHHRRRRASADFSYDPLSYALNFDDAANKELDYNHDDHLLASRNFTSRLPASPSMTATAMNLEIPTPTPTRKNRRSSDISTSLDQLVTGPSSGSKQTPSAPVLDDNSSSSTTTRRAVAIAEVRKSLETHPTINSSSSTVASSLLALIL